MEAIRVYIFKAGGVFIAGVLGYYAFVCGSIPAGCMFIFWSLVALTLTFNDTLDLKL